jgi:hypothetical protein
MTGCFLWTLFRINIFIINAISQKKRLLSARSFPLPELCGQRFTGGIKKQAAPVWKQPAAIMSLSIILPEN